MRLAVLLGSARPGRTGAVVAAWLERELGARGHALAVVDVAALPLSASEGARPEPALAGVIGGADAVVVVTPEYHHGYTGELKLAIDSVGPEWHGRPVGFVSYGGRSGGLIAVEQLRTVLAEVHTASARDPVSFHGAREAFDEDEEPRDAATAREQLDRMLAQLGWWADALGAARATRPFPS